MDTAALLILLRAAHVNNSLRTLAKRCGVSHESLRKLISCRDDNPPITKTTFDKINKGLNANHV